MNKQRLFGLCFLAAIVPFAGSISSVYASDHADSPAVAGDQSADLADCYLFEDPNDPSKIVLINTVRGFIVPGEAVNLAIFDPTIRYRFQVENTGDAKSDAFIDITFSEKNSAAAQTATVVFSGQAFDGINTKQKYSGKATAAGLGANPPPGYDGVSAYFPVVPQQLVDKNNQAIPVDFFAGETDDPFFFDIPGFARFRAKATANPPDPTAGDELNRGRDTFAGYNVLTMALRLPAELLVNTKVKEPETDNFGLSVLAQRGTERVSKGRVVSSGAFKTLDREGLPAVNALLIPLDQKNAYNGATTLDDAKGKFAPVIVATLQALGISDDNLALLASLAVERGDILRLNTGLPSGFPNGRKPEDDVVETLLTVIAGQALDDSVPENDVPFSSVFPYLGLPHQPRAPGVLDDSTRN